MLRASLDRHFEQLTKSPAQQGSMDNIRVFLWLTLLGMAWLTYTAWQADYSAAPRSTETSTRCRQPPQPAPRPQARFRPWTRLASRRRRRHHRGSPQRRRASWFAFAPTSSMSPSRRKAAISCAPIYCSIPSARACPSPSYGCSTKAAPERWVFQTGLRSAVGGAEPNHEATFRSASNEYSLASGQNELVVTLDWVGDAPISARKTYTFRRGRYDVELSL